MNKSIIALALFFATGQLYAAENNTFDALFEQVAFWQDRNRNDLAREALGRILNADPDNIEAMYRMGMIASKEDDQAQVQQWIRRIAQLAPTDPRLKELNALKAAQMVDPATLAAARRLASQGQYSASLKLYQEVFGGVTPPQDLAAEYYLTMAGAKEGVTEARKQLKKLYQARPAHSSVKQAYAQVLTYDESTRREGIILLAELAPTSEVADSAWRQALLWLNAAAADKKLYEQYQSVHPNDLDVMKYYQDKIQKDKANATTNNRTRGYQALNTNKLAEAERFFNRALAENARDADALAGLGLVQLKQQQFSLARESLTNAIALAPAKTSLWREAQQSADFYATMESARQLMEQQAFSQALALVQPLTKTAVPRAYEAQVLVGQLQHRLDQLDAATSTYNAILTQDADNVDAKLGLIAVLQSKGQWRDAERLSESLPEQDKQRVAYASQAEVQTLRQNARQSNELLAEINLRRAMKLAPQDPWVRLDLARLIDKQGEAIRARTIVDPLSSPSQPTESRYAAALFASEQNRWVDVERIMATIPPEARTAPMQALVVQATSRSMLSRILQRAAAGDRAGAQQLLSDLYQTNELDAKGVGELATELMKNGQPELGYYLVKLDLMQGLVHPAGQYLAHISVINEAGYALEAKSLLSELTIRSALTAADQQAFSQLQRGLAVREADQLRQHGQLALAYDVLAANLREAPENEALLLAMARLYQSGNKITEADEIYHYVLRLHPGNSDALVGAVNIALQQKKPQRAAELLARVNWNTADEPALLVMAARVAEATGDTYEATALLLRARKLAYQNTTTLSQSSNPFRENLQVPENPFKDKKQLARQTASSRPGWLPGQATAKAQQPESVAGGTATLFEQIDDMLLVLEQQRSTRIDTDVVLRVRAGTTGTSALDSVETPMVISTGAFGRGRVELNITPTALNSGTVSDESVNQYGRGAVVNASSGLSSRLNGVTEILDTIEDAAVAYDAAQSVYIAARDDTERNLPASEIARLLSLADTAKATFDRAVSVDLYDALGLSSANLTTEQQQLIQQFLLENYGATGIALSSDSLADFQTSRARLEQLVTTAQTRLGQMAVSTGDPPTQRSSGVALGVAYKNDWLQADVGTTPLGFEKTNVVGGITLQPEVFKNTRVVVQGERRAVKDSLLSYAGTKDHVSGETWGAVTKTGVSVGLNFDNGDAGAYGSLAQHQYNGENVASNKANSMDIGAYFRPLFSPMQQLQLGVHVGYSSFDKNLSKFTFGHGGYFSPQDYVSVAFPLNYSAAYEKYSYKLLFSPGFQSYSEDGNSLFPTDAAAQAALELFYNLGAFPLAGYAPSSKSGFGLSFGALGEYTPQPYLRIGGQLGFNSFGDYNETTMRLYIKYLIGSANE